MFSAFTSFQHEVKVGLAQEFIENFHSELHIPRPLRGNLVL